MPERPFLDTCIFVLALNKADSDHAFCRDLADPDYAAWPMILSEITFAESTLREHLNQIEIRCAQQGREWAVVTMAAVTAEKRQRRTFKKTLEKLGLSPSDMNQVFAASSGSANALVSRDLDFCSPRAKRNGRKSGQKGGDVAKAIINELQIACEEPKTAWERLAGARGVTDGSP